jgi:hypothetical protein
MDLIDLQGIRGVFKWGPAMQKMLGMGTREEVLAKGAEKGYKEESIWLTALAVAVIETKFGDEKELWELLADKAIQFLNANLKDVEGGVAKALEFAETFVKP